MGTTLNGFPVGELLVEELGFGARTLEEIRSRLLARHVRPDKLPQTGMIETSAGRVLFNSALPRPLQYVNDVLDKKRLSVFVGVCYELMGTESTAEVVDEIKKVKTGSKGFHQDVPVEDVVIESATLVE